MMINYSNVFLEKRINQSDLHHPTTLGIVPLLSIFNLSINLFISNAKLGLTISEVLTSIR